ncbi:MAG TPA: DMT family transporter [Actinomycetota bacterium]|jgi:drug/metabolite transporter (DMT)-like permease
MSAERVAAAPRDLRGPGLAVASGVLFGVVVIAGKPALGGDLPFTLLTWRFAGTCLALTVFALATRRPLRLARGEGVPILAAGFFGYGVEASLFWAALNHGSAAAVTLLFYTYPVSTMLIAMATGRLPQGGALWLALAAAMGGVLVLVAGGQDIDIEAAGVVLALACSLAYTLYLTVTDHALRRSNPLTAGIWLSGAAATFCLVAATVTRTFDVPSGWEGWRPIAVMALCTAGAFACMLAAIKRIGAVRTAIIGVFEPLSVAVLGAIWLDEPLTFTVVAGGLLILVAAVLATRVRGERVVEPDL